MGGRCVAGLGTNGEGWIRPIAGDTDHGQLYQRHYNLGQGEEPEILDIVEIELLRSRPIPGQPENWEIGDRPWNLIRRPAGRDSYPILDSAVSSGPILLGSAHASIGSGPAAELTSSLALVRPNLVSFHVRFNQRGQLQPRTVFSLWREKYDLPITDPAWHSRIVRALSAKPGLAHAKTDVGMPENGGIIFTISLSEPFGGPCYKLVAGIIVLPSLG